MNTFGSEKTPPYRIYHDPFSGWFLWSVEIAGETIGGQGPSPDHALRDLNLVISAAGFPPVEGDSKPHRTSTPYLLRKGSHTLSYIRYDLAPRLLQGLGLGLAFVLVINLVCLGVAAALGGKLPDIPPINVEFLLVFGKIPLIFVILCAGVSLISRASILQKWNSAWRRPSTRLSLPWPLGEQRLPGDPATAPPLHWGGEIENAHHEHETYVFQFLNEARRIFFGGEPKRHPLLDALQKRALEKKAHKPVEFESPKTLLQQSVDEWMGDRLRNMRYSARFVREAFDANPPAHAKTRCCIDYIESASDFRNEESRLLRLRNGTYDAAYWLACASWIIVPTATYFCWTYTWEFRLPPRFFLSVMLIFPALILVLRATMRRAEAEFEDLKVQHHEAKLLSQVDEGWDCEA